METELVFFMDYAMNFAFLSAKYELSIYIVHFKVGNMINKQQT